MLNAPTLEQMTSMRLGAMAVAWEEQNKNPKYQKIGFDDRLALLIEAEWSSRESKRQERALRAAKLRIAQASIEGVECSPGRGIAQAQLRQLATTRWLDEKQNVILSGATGTGKTYIACALGDAACRKGKKVLYRRAPRLLDELRLARASGDYATQLKKFERFDLIIIDDWAIAPLKDYERQDILEVLEDRYEIRSTLIAGQLPPEKWHSYIGDPTLADAICDRVLHNAHKIMLKGPSRRKEASSKNK